MSIINIALCFLVSFSFLIEMMSHYLKKKRFHYLECDQDLHSELCLKIKNKKYPSRTVMFYIVMYLYMVKWVDASFE